MGSGSVRGTASGSSFPAPAPRRLLYFSMLIQHHKQHRRLACACTHAGCLFQHAHTASQAAQATWLACMRKPSRMAPYASTIEAAPARAVCQVAVGVWKGQFAKCIFHLAQHLSPKVYYMQLNCVRPLATNRLTAGIHALQAIQRDLAAPRQSQSLQLQNRWPNVTHRRRPHSPGSPA